MNRPTRVNELRRSYLDFFESKGHLVLPSFSLVPHNDKSLLLINAGMAPLKPYFTGQEEPPRRRVATCQKCVRTGDIDNVGKTARHLTFFEMLGNFSFGDYFKTEAIHWSWEYLTEVLGLDPDRLYPSIYGEDEEAFRIWHEEIGIAPERITRFWRDPETGACDNFWEHGAGPCGPCSEIYYDRGEKYGCGRPDCKVGCDCDRFMEVWNNVFTQFESDGAGHYEELSQKNIDTGMGLERLAVVMQDVDSVFDIDTMKAIRDAICAEAKKTYQTDALDDISIRLITDHIRSTTFMVSDGILPSNEGRGYVLRRLIRRAARHGRMLGIEGEFLAKLSEVVISESSDGYPELLEKRDLILGVLTEEERRFNKTIDQGLALLSGMMDELAAGGQKTLPGEDAFRLYDTYGFPIDLTEEILKERGFSYDREAFWRAMEQQRTQARERRAKSNYMGADETVFDTLDTQINTAFCGYDGLSASSEIRVLTLREQDTEELAASLLEGQKGAVVTDETPFYATMGGQVGDTGRIETETGIFAVEDTVKVAGGRTAHLGRVVSGTLSEGQEAALSVDALRRGDIAKNHSATHLMQRALREVLGDHVQQAGSLVEPDRLRFDFTHFSAMSPEEIAAVETLVNERIAAAVPVETAVMTLEEARKTGAMALFGEKYGEEVRVVTMGDYSTELCGGTHVDNTGKVGAFKILSESGVAAGVRRIEALTGRGLVAYYQEIEQTLARAAEAAKTTPAGLAEKITHLNAEIKALASENESLKSAAARAALGDAAPEAETVKGLSFIARKLSGVDMNGLRELGDTLKDGMEDGVAVLASEQDGRVNLMVTATEGAVQKGVHAGNLIKAIAGLVGGGGGGRPGMAQAGGKNPSGIDAALSEAGKVLAQMVSGEGD